MHGHSAILQVLWGECISGALYRGDFLAICKRIGFLDPRLVSNSEISISDPELRDLIGNAHFYSSTYRLFKLPGLLEPAHENYGQKATYMVSLLSLTKVSLVWEFSDLTSEPCPCAD